MYKCLSTLQFKKAFEDAEFQNKALIKTYCSGTLKYITFKEEKYSTPPLQYSTLIRVWYILFLSTAMFTINKFEFKDCSNKNNASLVLCLFWSIFGKNKNYYKNILYSTVV
uniref:Uncharacterized protein n=1 Tax=Anguilla anguilla TaxID=7936 RepID=A0A0E9X596_ANGAN